MKKIASILFSHAVMMMALIGFAAAMAVATFVENDYGTPVARQAIYDSWWFEALMLILVLNFVGNIYRYRLLRQEKIGILLFHLAFIVILVGALITRYTGYEGLIRIREGQSANQIISQERYLRMQVQQADKTWGFNQKVALTQLNQPDFELTAGRDDDPLRIQAHRYVADAVQGLVPGDEDDEVIEIVTTMNGGRSGVYLGDGSSVYIEGHEVTFNNPKEGAINIEGTAGQYVIRSSETLDYVVMATQQMGRLLKDVPDTLRTRALYQSDHLKFVVSDIHRGQRLDYQTAENEEQAQNAADLLFVEVSHRDTERHIILAALDGVFSPLQEFTVEPYQIQLSYGPKLLSLPFALRLQDFQLERYPGSVSPSSYASEMIVEDPDGDFPVRISMNNVLDHRGYRFFQASYDLDELGTVLSVNKDFWGTQVTYLGYLLMGMGMLITLFGRRSRFALVGRKLQQLKLDKAMIWLALLVPLGALSNPLADVEKPTPGAEKYIDPDHARAFGELMVQDMDGRIKPISTLASEFLRKLTRKTTYPLEEQGSTYQLSADQVFLAIHQNPIAWQTMPLIKVDATKGENILILLEQEGNELLSFQDLLDDDGSYQLRSMVESAQRKKPAERSELDNEIIAVDERFNILFQALSGNYLKIFPQPEASDDKWFNPGFSQAGFSEEDSVFVRNILSVYYQDIDTARQTGEWFVAQDKLLYLKTFQEAMGSDVIPAPGRIRAELLYNDLGLFNKLFPVYWLLGIYLLVLALVRMFFDQPWLRAGYLLGIILTALAFLAQTGNMILRWYAGDYPPWSNGYEMIILVSWALFLFGFIFYRKSDFIMPLVALFGGTLLFVSYLDWLNPEITNLVPVLKSYWLKIHVAIIVSSYAPLALSALLGLLTMTFMVVGNKKFSKPILELTYINELSMTIGLFMLAIGTFLGGVWANESWGRYWGWDPKETWALISIIVYVIVLHLRLIPTLRDTYVFSLASVIAFFSIVMTSFGVNYYLSGLHSYAAGDPLPVPEFVYWVVGFIFLLATLAYWRKSRSSVSATSRHLEAA